VSANVFNVSHEAAGVDLCFAASLENIDKAIAETKAFLTRIHAQQYTFDVTLVLREALSNAVVDGCGQDPKMRVSCRLRFRGRRLIMEIEDPGRGFNWRGRMGKLPPPEAESGRGMVIMEHYCEMVSYNDKGNRLMMEKIIRPGRGVAPK